MFQTDGWTDRQMNICSCKQASQIEIKMYQKYRKKEDEVDSLDQVHFPV